MLLDHLGNVKQKKEESLKSYLNRFTMELFRVRWAPDVEVLAYLTNGVLPETPFWDELQQKECKSVSKFYKNASKFLKLENSKKALHKVQGASSSRKSDQGEKAEKRRAEEK